MTEVHINTAAGSWPDWKSVAAEWWPVATGFLLLYVPTFRDAFLGLWTTDEQGHGPIILSTALFLLWRKRAALCGNEESNGLIPGFVVLTIGLLLYIVGRSQQILMFEIGSLIWVMAGMVLTMRGPAALKDVRFPLFFMIFMIPLPGTVTDALTMPMKMAVSYVVEHMLFLASYPIARTGVILQVGQYRMLVADACAGLHTLFALEALGLLYLNLVRHASLLRNVVLALMIIPISFSANVIRVLMLTLITYHFGDAAGQGFAHAFAGIVLFISALLLIISFDSILRMGARRRPEQ